MKLVQEFKEFALKGNMVDMAVGIIIGAGFGKIVSSLVADVIMPPLGLLLGNKDFSRFAFTLKEARGDLAAVTLNYGKFIQTVLDFMIVAIVIFLVIRGMNALRRRKEPAPQPSKESQPSREETLLAEIRDILKSS